MTAARRSGNPARRTGAAPTLAALRSLAVDNTTITLATDPSPYPLPPLSDPLRVIQGILGGISTGAEKVDAITPGGAAPIPGHIDRDTVVATVIYQPGLLRRLLEDRRRDLSKLQVATVTQQRARERVATGRTITPYVRVIVLPPLDDDSLPVEQLAEITHASEISRPFGIQLMASTNAPLDSYVGGLASPTGRRGYLAAIAKNFLDLANVGRDTTRQRRAAGA